MMLYAVALSFCIFGIPGGDANPDKKLLAEGIKYAADCAVSNGIKFDVCAEMYKEGADLNDAKYKECKCWVPCVAKKMKAMTDDGKWDMDVVKKIVSNLQTAEWKAEAERVLPMCQDSTGTGCDVGFNAFVCVMKNSEKAKMYVTKMLNAMAGH